MGKTFNKLQFVGHSDDIIGVHRERHVQYCDAQGDSIHDDDDEISANYDADFTTVKVSNVGGSRVCLVHCLYAGVGTWSFAVSMLEEERNLPPWKFTIDQPEHKYSTRLTIESDEDELIYEKVGGEKD